MIKPERDVPTPYQAWQHRTFSIAGSEIEVATKPGFANWSVVTPATLLLAEAVPVDSGTRVLVIGGGHGALAVVLAGKKPGGHVTLLDINHVATLAASRTLIANGVENAAVIVGPIDSNSVPNLVDIVVIESPADRRLARRLLAEAQRVLEPGGRMYLAGATNLGIRSIADDAAALFGNLTVLDTRRKHRVVRCSKVAGLAPIPSWADEPGIAPYTRAEFDARTQDVCVTLGTSAGVFSHGRVDRGTQLLGDLLDIRPGARVVDIGAGCGTLGLWAASMGAGTVDLVEANLLAVADAQVNIRANGFANVRVHASDVLDAVSGNRYDLALMNPPFHAGRAIDYSIAAAFVEQAAAALDPGGELRLVANRFLPYDRLLDARFGNVRQLYADANYHVLSATQFGP